jgi:hypothetical protein
LYLGTINILSIGFEYQQKFYNSLLQSENKDKGNIYNNFYWIAPKIHEHNIWDKESFNFLANFRNKQIEYVLANFKSDYFLISDDDVIINENLFTFLKDKNKDMNAIGFHNFSQEFKKDLITQQNDLYFGNIIQFENKTKFDLIPNNVFPDQIYFIKTDVIKEIGEKYNNQWFQGNSNQLETRDFINKIRNLSKIYLEIIQYVDIFLHLT